MPSELDVCSSPAVAITGIGLVTALGITAEQTWQAIRAGQSGAGPMSAMESALPPGADGYQAPDLPADYEPTLPREARYLRWTIEAALKDAGPLAPTVLSRTSIVLGTTLHGMRAAGRFIRTNDYTQLQQFLAGDTIRLATRGMGLHGPAVTTCSACSSSLGSIALGKTLLETGHADLVVAGGYDTISEYVWAGFNALRLIADGPLRPFTKQRRGMKVGEGYAIVILERAQDAAHRNARITAIVAGCGESADAHHLTQPHPQGQGACRAMRAALSRADLAPAQLNLIAAHATGTPDNDSAEHAAMRELLGNQLPNVPVVCFKTHLGHTLGAAGAAELILSTLAIRDRIAPASANVDPSQLEFTDLRIGGTAAAEHSIQNTLNTSLGFGGKQHLRRPFICRAKTILLGNVPPHARSLDHRHRADPAGNREPRTIHRPAPFSLPAWQQPPAPLLDDQFEHLLNTRRVRRMSSYVKAMLAAATLACRDGGLVDHPQLLADTGAILGTTHGPSAFSYDYYSQIVRDGVLAANPVLFAEGVPNAGAAQLSLMLGLHGGCQSIIGTRTAGLDALRLAWLGIANAEADRTIVGAGEESQSVVNAAYDHCGLRQPGPSGPPFTSTSGFCSTAGAVSLILESADAARARGAAPYAVIEHAAAFNGCPEALPRTLAQLLESFDQPPLLISSANGTWIDKVETHAIARNSTPPIIASVYDAFGEAFSATPLLGLAGALLMRQLPTLDRDQSVRWLPGNPRIDRFGVLCTDWQGAAASAVLRILDRMPTGT